jgi:GNAT superfamily N-acetyltransferase
VPELTTRPDLDQLRRQARELLRAVQADDADARSRLQAVDAPVTLAGAQLALAREHGFPSWPKFKAEVERRASATSAQVPTPFVLRYVRTPGELRHLWVAVHAILGVPPRDLPHWHVFDDFEAKRTTMLVLEHGGRVIGGAIQLRLLAIEPWARGLGLGRRLVQTVEAELLAVGGNIRAHAGPEAKGFFLRLGYIDGGRSRQHLYKGAPLSRRLVERRLEIWRRRAGDLATGVPLEVDPSTGRVPSLPW